MPTVTINRFDGGVVNNGRFPGGRFAKAVANFNILSDPYRLIPYIDSEDGDSSASSNQIRNFCLGKRGSTVSVFGLGINGSNRPSIFYRDLSDLEDATWSATANNTIGSGSQYAPELFIYYPNQDKVYHAFSSTGLGEYDPDTPSVNQSLDLSSAGLGFTSFTNASNAVLHSKDDIVYAGLDRYVIKKNGSASWALGLTLPAGTEIVSMCEYGNYLAIGVRQTSLIGKCTVYLWDRDSSLTTLSESVSWGDENLRIIEEIEGELVGISTQVDTTADLFERVIFRRYVAGAGAIKFLELDAGLSPTVGIQLPRSIQQKFNGRLYFMMTITIHGAVRTGVWSIGRNSGTREWTLVHERTSDNDTALNSSHNLRGFLNVGDFLFQSHQDNSTYEMTKSSDQGTYTATSYFETVVNPSMPAEHFFAKKRLKAVSLHFERLPSGATASVKFRADSATAWSSITALISEDTDNAVFKETTVVDNSGSAVTADGREFEFRIESTGGAVITGLSYSYELLKSLTP